MKIEIEDKEEKDIKDRMSINMDSLIGRRDLKERLSVIIIINW